MSGTTMMQVAVSVAVVSCVSLAAPRAATSDRKDDATRLPYLSPAARAGWEAYIAHVETRQARDSATTIQVLRSGDGTGIPSVRRALLAGQVITRPASAAETAPVRIPGARVHHWLGAIFIPSTTVDRLIASLEERPPAQRDVVRAVVLHRERGGMRVLLRVRHQQLVTVIYDTEHDVVFTRDGPGRARSTTRATRIVEVQAVGTPRERELEEDEDHDFLWRLHAYWRYAQVPGGVVAECESVSLSRDVPLVLRPIAHPLIARTADDAMRAALLALRAARSSSPG